MESEIFPCIQLQHDDLLALHHTIFTEIVRFRRRVHHISMHISWDRRVEMSFARVSRVVVLPLLLILFREQMAVCIKLLLRHELTNKVDVDGSKALVW